jgi:hypothetical protein
VRVVAVGHLAQDSLAQGCGPGTRGASKASAGDGRAGLGLAAVGALAHYQSGSGVDRFRDRAGRGPFTVDPVLGDLTQVPASSGGPLGQQLLDASSSSPHGLTRNVAASPLRSAELDSVLGQTPPRPRELRRLNLTLQVIVSTFT